MFAVSTAAFKAYDVRGRLPDELNSDIAYRIGRAYAEYLEPGEVVVGHDIRLSSPELTPRAAQAEEDIRQLRAEMRTSERRTNAVTLGAVLALGGFAWLALGHGAAWLAWALLAAGAAKLVYGLWR